MSPSALLPGESTATFAATPVLQYLRPGEDRAAPLVVFLSGGGHLARVAYGHVGAAPADFLDHWLAREGLGLLALSYPCDHPAIRISRPDLSLGEWAEAAAEAARQATEAMKRPRRLILVAWSMGARAGAVFAKAAAARDLEIEAFMPMAGSPPMPGLSSTSAATELFLENGLWDVFNSPVRGAARGEAWVREISAINARHDRTVLSIEDYRTHYLAGAPISLLGDANFKQRQAEESGHDDLAAFPLAAPISPDQMIDHRHALMDSAVWGFVNSRVVLRRWVEPAIVAGETVAPEAWDRLRNHMAALPRRLIRHVRGGHLFFIGEKGAQATARAIVELLAESRAATAEFDALFDSGARSHRSHTLLETAAPKTLSP